LQHFLFHKKSFIVDNLLVFITYRRHQKQSNLFLTVTMSDYIGMEKLKDEEMEKWSTNLMNKKWKSGAPI